MRLAPYFEQRRFPIWALALGLVMTASLGIAWGTAAGSSFGWVTGSLFSFLTLVSWFSAARPVVVDESGLAVGNWHLDPAAIESAEALDADQFTDRIRANARGDDALSLFGSGRGGVVVTLNDPGDPYLHWVIRSKNPQALAAAISALANS